MDIHSVLLLRVSSLVDKVDHPQFFDPCYQLKYIEAGLAELGDVEVHSHDCWIRPLAVEELLALAASLRPDMVVVSSSSFDVDVANDFVRGLAERGLARAVVGIGQGGYLNHDSADDRDAGYDAVMLGEPEEEFRVLFDRMRRDDGDWRREYWKRYKAGHRYAVRDLDGLPFPRYTREELRAYRSIYPLRTFERVVWGFLIAGRGCPYACTFCSEVMRVSIGTKMRIRSGASVADEMEHLVRQGANVISFQDDSFASSKALVRNVCNELIARGSRIRWMARLRADEVDYELLSLMKRAGCIMLGIGVEAGSQRVIDRMKKTYQPKPWAELARRVFRWTRQLGIGTNAYYVLGNPTETYAEIEQTIELALELEADSIQVHFHTPYPGSADWAEFHGEFAKEHDATRMFHYARPLFTMADTTPDELMELRSRFYRRYLFRPRFALRHLWHYGPFYLRNPGIFFTLLGIRKVMGKDAGRRGASAAAETPELVLQPHAPVKAPRAARAPEPAGSASER